MLPAVAYLAFFGWTVPAIAVEGRGFRDSFARSLRLARSDYVHAAGGLATLVILFVVVRLMLLFFLRTGGEAGERLAVALADLVLSPMLFVGSAIVYIDLAAREQAKPVSSGHRLEEALMPKYVMLTTLTAKGVQTFQANPDRIREVNRDVEELGAKVLHQWATVGPYDFLNIVEAPDAATIAKVSVALGARGSAKLQTFELIEIDDLLARLAE